MNEEHSKAPENRLPALEQASQASTDESWKIRRKVQNEYYEAGKSEAFNLVRNLLTEKISIWANTKSTALEREKATVLDVLRGLLSTLEGK